MLKAYLPSCFGGWARSHLRVASAFLESDVRTNIYVDGFNLYYGALRKTPYRWVNLEALFQFLLPQNTIQEIKNNWSLTPITLTAITEVNTSHCIQSALTINF